MSRTREFTVEGACLECHHLGWFPANHDEVIERCDNCKVFADDNAAMAHALVMAIDALKRPRRRRGVRFEAVLAVLQIAVYRARGPEDDDYEE